MVELRDDDIDAALHRGAAVKSAEPRAASARYDLASGRVVVDLTNGSTFAFPPSLAQGLDHATAAQLAEIELLGGGYGMHWPKLGTDLSIPGLLVGIFGTAAYMARRAGRTLSPAKAAAARANGAKGGRPRKISAP